MNKPFNITIFVKDIIFIPPTMKTLDLLMKMKETGIKIAIVVDEYGGVDGLISVHDLVEEIIGDIQDADELKNNKQKVTKNYDGTFTADAKTTLIEFAKTTGLKLTSVNKQIDSIGGYIISKTGKVPVRGELISCPKSNVEFEVLDADSRKIKSVKIKKLA
jgi:CBS domain containing-hemolysin-like protein